MLKHIVIWQVVDRPDGTSAETLASEMVRRLNDLEGRIPELLRIEAGAEVSPTGGSAGVVLYSEFADAEGLAAYQAHPDHRAVSDFIGSLGATRCAVDCEA